MGTIMLQEHEDWVVRLFPKTVSGQGQCFVLLENTVSILQLKKLRLRN